MKKNNIRKTTKKQKQEQDSSRQTCSLCGQLYHSFAFKGGYICEDCLHAIKYSSPSAEALKK